MQRCTTRHQRRFLAFRYPVEIPGVAIMTLAPSATELWPIVCPPTPIATGVVGFCDVAAAQGDGTIGRFRRTCLSAPADRDVASVALLGNDGTRVRRLKLPACNCISRH